MSCKEVKRGIMEMADGLVITKADGENAGKARGAMAEYSGALHPFPVPASGVMPQVTTCSALTGEGIEHVARLIEDYAAQTRASGFFTQKTKKPAARVAAATDPAPARDQFLLG